MKFSVAALLAAILAALAITVCQATPQTGGLNYWNLIIKWEYNIAFDHEMGYESHNPPIIADVDSDGSPEVVIHGLTFQRGFIVLDGSTGREEWRADLPGVHRDGHELGLRSSDGAAAPRSGPLLRRWEVG